MDRIKMYREKHKMLSVDRALETILSYIHVLDETESPLLQCLGQVAAEDVYAGFDIPGWESSAMDGFAVRSEDTRGAAPRNPRILNVIGTARAGVIPRKSVAEGMAIRIMTGAIIPSGADCVVRFEDTEGVLHQKKGSGGIRNKIAIIHEQKPGSNIRKAGENISGGSIVVSRGSTIGPAEVSVLAALGNTRIKVIRRPLVAIIATGEELKAPGKPVQAPQLYNSNAYAIGAQVLRCGGTPLIAGIARDNRSSILSKVRRGLKADMIITSGGVFLGDYDLVKNIQAEMGRTIFWQVGMVPGKGFAFGLIRKVGAGGEAGDIPHFALPGNPPAGMITFEVLVRPAVRKMLGMADLWPEMIEAVIEDSLENQTGARRFAWVALEKGDDGYHARLTRSMVKGVLNSIVLAGGLAVVPEGVRRVKKGDKLNVVLLDWK